MRITLLGHNDLASLYAMNRILSGAPHHQYAIFLSGAQDTTTSPPASLQKLAAIDGDLSARFLQGRQTSTILRESRDLPAPNHTDGLAALGATDPDLIVSIRYRRILKGPAIAIPRHGVLNLHSGILPDYRGVMASFWAMLNGETEIGSTLHRITDDGIDTGPVITISRQVLLPERSYLANVLSLYRPGCDAALAAIALLGNGVEPQANPQNVGAGRYFSTPAITDLERFLGQGLVLARGDELEAVASPDSGPQVWSET